MPRAMDVLRDKASQGRDGLVSISPDNSVLEAAQRMNQHRIGSLAVVDEAGRLAGMFTERDVLTRIVAAGRPPAGTLVRDVMTTEVVTCGPRTPVDELRQVMREKRIRHVPVIENGRLIGVVSIGDLNATEQRVMVETISYLEQYMHMP